MPAVRPSCRCVAAWPSGWSQRWSGATRSCYRPCPRSGWYAGLAEHHKVVGPVVRSRGGRIVKRLGDGLLLTFPEAEAAVLACLEMVDGLPGPLRLRAGINLGPVVVTRDDVIGHEVNVAARVTEAARAGEVLVTAPVRQATASSLLTVTFGRQRRRSFKGLTEAIGVSRVTLDAPPPAGGTR